MDPSARLLRVLSLLEDRRTVSAAELADRLGVTTRTVRRDVARLRDLGYPVDVEPGRTGYQLGPGARLPPLLLDDEEAFAIAHGLRLAAAAPVGGVEDAALAALRKLDQLLPGHVRERVRAVDAATVHLDATITPPVSVDVLILLASACREREQVTFTYADFRGAVSDRRVEPVRLVHVDHRWHLVGRDRNRDDWRTFRVDRITDAARTGHHFDFDADGVGDVPDAARRVIEGITVAGRPHVARVLVDVEPDDARRRYSRFAVIEPGPTDGQSILRMGADSLNQIARSIASMSCTWRVLDPPELDKEIRAHARRLTKMAVSGNNHASA